MAVILAFHAFLAFLLTVLLTLRRHHQGYQTAAVAGLYTNTDSLAGKIARMPAHTCAHTHTHRKTQPEQDCSSWSSLPHRLLWWLPGRSTQFYLRNPPKGCVAAENTIVFLLITFLLPFESTEEPEKHNPRAHKSYDAIGELIYHFHFTAVYQFTLN